MKHGILFKETLGVANQLDLYLIVVGSQGRSVIQEMLADCTIENVARLSRQPVLAVRPERS